MKEKIYLLPGLMTDERLWSRVKPLLEEEFELIHVPLPLTDDFNESAKELETIFQEEEINLLGFSLGAYTAAYFTVKNPNRVKKLFLLAGTTGCMNQIEVEKREQTLKQMNHFGFKGLSHKKVLSLIEESSHDDEELIQLIKDMFVDLGLEVYNVQMKSTFNRVDITEDLKSLKIPTKLYYSTEDRLLSHRVLNKIDLEDEHIKLVSRVGTSHMISLEEPQKLATEIKEWIK